MSSLKHKEISPCKMDLIFFKAFLPGEDFYLLQIEVKTFLFSLITKKMPQVNGQKHPSNNSS